MIIAITGATGFIGGALTTALRADGHEVRRLTRHPRAADDHAFDPARRLLDPRALAGADAVVHLAGEPIAQRWTGATKQRIRESRIEGTRLLASALAGATSGPRTFVSGSAIGIYGDRGDTELTEGSALGDDFLGQVGREWEAAAATARLAGVRVVHPRMGVVLDRQGGALERMLPPFRLGVGARLGSGRQWMSWISLADAVAALRFLVETPAAEGPVNLVGPAPATNAEFTRALAAALGRPALGPPVPAFALRLVYGEMADATLYASQRVLPERLTDLGFRFQHPTLAQALASAVG